MAKDSIDVHGAEAKRRRKEIEEETYETFELNCAIACGDIIRGVQPKRSFLVSAQRRGQDM